MFLIELISLDFHHNLHHTSTNILFTISPPDKMFRTWSRPWLMRGYSDAIQIIIPVAGSQQRTLPGEILISQALQLQDWTIK